MFIRNIGLLLLAIVASLLLIPLSIIRNLVYKITDFEEFNFYIFAIAHGIDVMGASVLFSTTYKTVSGVTGKKAIEERAKGLERSYIYPFEKFIDWLFNDPKHCYKAYIKEYKCKEEV